MHVIHTCMCLCTELAIAVLHLDKTVHCKVIILVNQLSKCQDNFHMLLPDVYNWHDVLQYVYQISLNAEGLVYNIAYRKLTCTYMWCYTE